jgi:hypothetical protein
MKSRIKGKLLSQIWAGLRTYLPKQQEAEKYALHTVVNKIDKTFSKFIEFETGIIKCRLVKDCEWNFNKIRGMVYDFMQSWFYY